MQLFILILNGQNGQQAFDIQVAPEDPISVLKQKVFEEKAVAVNRQRVLFQGKEWHDDKTMKECRFENESKVFVVVRAEPTESEADRSSTQQAQTQEVSSSQSTEIVDDEEETSPSTPSPSSINSSSSPSTIKLVVSSEDGRTAALSLSPDSTVSDLRLATARALYVPIAKRQALKLCLLVRDPNNPRARPTQQSLPSEEQNALVADLPLGDRHRSLLLVQNCGQVHAASRAVYSSAAQLQTLLHTRWRWMRWMR